MRKNILITGDSWAAGEWDKKQVITHCGLQEYFMNAGYSVKNISKPGGTLEEIVSKLDNEDLSLYDYIFVIVTCTNRTVTNKFTNQENFFNLIPFNKETIIHRHKNILDNFFQQLNNYNKPIYLLGGLSVVPSALGYQNLKVALPSILKFILPKLAKDYEFFFHLGNSYPKHIDKDTIDWMWQQNKIWEQIQSSKYFREDGYHPNRYAHYKVFRYLIENVIDNDK
jgi:hypothetical protein